MCVHVYLWEAQGHMGGHLYVSVCICVCVSICQTYNAAGPHSPFGMWDFQVQNRPHHGRRAGTNRRDRGKGAERRRGRRRRGEKGMTDVLLFNLPNLSKSVGAFLWFIETGSMTVTHGITVHRRETGLLLCK